MTARAVAPQQPSGQRLRKRRIVSKLRDRDISATPDRRRSVLSVPSTPSGLSAFPTGSNAITRCVVVPAWDNLEPMNFRNLRNILIVSVSNLRLWRDTRGQDLIEYALMAGFVAVAAGAIMPGVASSISVIFSQVNSIMVSSAAS